VNSQNPPRTSRLERIFSAVWVAAVTALAIPALIAAFSREPARQPHDAPTTDTRTTVGLAEASANVNDNATRLRGGRAR
jgi:hypothetical protein